MNTTFFCLFLCQICFILANEFDTASISTRHLLGHNRVQSASLTEKKSSPTKYSRTGSNEKPHPPLYIRPPKSSTHKHKTRSYSELLTAKNTKKQNKTQILKKKKPLNKQKNGTAKEKIVISKVRELVPINDAEIDRCRTLLRTQKSDSSREKQTKQKKKSEVERKKIVEISSPQKPEEKSLPPKTEEKEEKPKSEENPKKKSSSNKNDEIRTEKQIENVVGLDESITNDNSIVSNSSVVDRAFHFVKNMFQLSDDNLENDGTTLKENLDNEEQEIHHHQSRKLLSIENFDDSTDYSFSKRRLLSNKPKQISSKKEKKISNLPSENNKPKVGWAYRYRISRYLAAQKEIQERKRTKTSNVKTLSKSKEKKGKSSNDKKTSKRKLLQFDHSDSQISNEDLINSVTFTQPFRPKRLHKEKPGNARPPSTGDDQTHESYRMKYSDPILLVPTHEEKFRREKPSKNNAEIRRNSDLNKEKGKEKSVQHSSEKDDNDKKLTKKTENSTSLLEIILSKAQRSVCFFPLTRNILYCREYSNETVEEKNKPRKKLRTKKEHVAKQFIRSRPTKLGREDKATERRVDEIMRSLYAQPSLPPVEVPPISPVRYRTISEVIREQSDVFVPVNRQQIRTQQEIQHENDEIIAEKTKHRSSQKLRALDRNKPKD